jgi:hypothetical protein
MTSQDCADEQRDVLTTPELSPRSLVEAESRPQTSLVQRAKRLTVNLVIGFHLIAIACWCVPVDSALIPLCRNLARPYFLWAGLFQSWDMFAPIPKGANTYIEARLLYRDRTERTWTYARMEQMSLKRTLFKERYRKFADNLQREDLDDLLVDAVRHIARLNSSPDNPVKTVILIQRSSFIVPRSDGTYVPEPWEAHVLLGYGVRSEDLK